MFDISLGEVAVLVGVGIVLIGRKDLPYASHALGRQVGRVVGLLQGARIRADRFATDNQLRQLQNEFRSGLRELDAVKAELAGAMMTRGGLGGNMGAMVPGVDRKKPPLIPSSPFMHQSIGAEYLAAAKQAELSQTSPLSLHGDVRNSYNVAPRSQSVAAVAEEEWEKQGIGFQSIAERGASTYSQEGNDSAHHKTGTNVGGATILSNFLRQSLIFDQYERNMREQDAILRSRAEKVREQINLSDNDKSQRH